MEYEKILVKLMEKTIKEVHEIFSMDQQSAASKFGKNANNIDRFLVDRADAILSGVQFFIDAQKSITESVVENE